MDELSFSDHQRDLVIKLCEKRKKLFNLHNMRPNATKGTADGSLDVAPNKSNKHMEQIFNLENESTDIFNRLCDSLAGRVGGKARHSTILPDDNQDDDYFDRTKKRPKTSIPKSTTTTDTKESITQKLSILYQLRAECEDRIESITPPAAESGDDEDPFEAFMASTEKEVNSKALEEEQGKLDTLNDTIARLEESRSMMELFAFTDPSYKKPREEKSVPSQSAPSSIPKGQGTVWESEFARDESVPTRLAKRQTTGSTSTVPVSLNPRQGGLQFIDKTQSDTYRSVVTETETNDAKMEALRKKLGY